MVKAVLTVGIIQFEVDYEKQPLSSCKQLDRSARRFAAVAAVATFWFAVRKSKADIRRTYSAAVRRNITDFEFQLRIWQDNFRDSQYLIVATAALRDALERDGVPSPATQAFDEYIARHGGSPVPRCLEHCDAIDRHRSLPKIFRESSVQSRGTTCRL